MQRFRGLAEALFTLFSAILSRKLILGNLPFLDNLAGLWDQWLFEKVKHNLMVNTVIVFLALYVLFAAECLELPPHFDVLQSEVLEWSGK